MERLIYLFVSLLFIISRAAGDGHAESCWDNQPECERKMRELMTDETRFWYGDEYFKQCNVTSTSSECENFDRFSKSILQRFYSTLKSHDEIKKIAAGLEMATMTYNAPEETIKACGNETHLPALRNYMIDPLKVTVINQATQASLRFAPQVDWWNFDPELFYTAIMWDAGSGFLHALYVDVRNGDVSTGTGFYPYSGPNNPAPRENTYLLLIMPQNRSIIMDPGLSTSVGNALKEIITPQNGYQFMPHNFLKRVPGVFGDPVAGSILITTGDIYAAQKAKEGGWYNGCPWFASQNKYLYKALTTTDVAPYPFWLKNGDHHMLWTVAYELHIEYVNYDMEFLSCCSESVFKGKTITINPFNNVPEMPVYVHSKPQVKITPVNMMDPKAMEGHFTLMMVDFETPDMSPMGLRLHWLVTNIPNGNVNDGETVIDYFGATPLSKRDTHMYVFLLFKQKDHLKWWDTIYDYRTDMNCMEYSTDRCKYQLARMINEWHLQGVNGVTWFMATQDEYARHQIYDEWKVRSKYDVCKEETTLILPDGHCMGDPEWMYEDVRDGSIVTSSIVLFVYMMAAVATFLVHKM